MPVQIARRHFSVAEYDRIVESGILGKDDRVELIEGEVVEMSPIGKRHAACVRKLTRTLSRVLGDRSQISVQNPVVAGSWSEPQPDVALLIPREDFYASFHPSSKHVQVLIEVADNSVDYDLQVKAPVYAQAGIKEVWVIDLKQNEVVVFARPRQGVYRRRDAFGPADAIESARLGGAVIRVRDLLP